jgi:phage major head subunit gpT-like protein
MALQVTFPVLTSINNAVNTAYNVQIDAVDSVYTEFSSETNSTGAAEVYPRLDLISGLREWIGDRVVQQLGLHTFSITNRLFEETISVLRTDIEDDKYGFLGQAAQQLGQNAGELPDLLAAQLLIAGNTIPCYDGQNFFDPSHPQYDKYGNATTVANYFPGSGGNIGPAWYLFDTRKVIKPMIHQKRRPFEIIPKFSMTDPSVFFNKEFVWGVDGRMNMGFGIWDLAAMSTLPLTAANFNIVRTAMMSHHKPNGAPLNIKPTIWVGPSTLYGTAKKLFEGEYDLDSTNVIASNPWKGACRVVENTWLN